MPQITDLTVNFISLVKRPATGKSLTLKGDQSARVFEIKKTDDERMVAYGIVYAPDQEDLQGDQADAATIRRAAYRFMHEAKTQQVDTEHNFQEVEAYVAESWLVRKGDPLFPDEPEDAWAVGIQITSPDLWKKLKSDEFTGLSLAGIATVEPQSPGNSWAEKQESAPGLLQALLSTLKKDSAMTEDNIRKFIQEELAKSSPAPEEPTKEAEQAQTPEPEPAITRSDLDDLEGRLSKAMSEQIAKALIKGATETAPPAHEESYV